MHRRTAGARVVGVTGSAGKTSTKELLALLLGGAPAVLATEGNLNNLIGVPLTLQRIEPLETKLAVVEAGIDRPGEMRALASMIQPDCAIVTLIGPAHLERLGSLEGVAQEKSELLRWLTPGGLGVVPWSAWNHPVFRHTGAEMVVALPNGADFSPENPHVKPEYYHIRNDATSTEIVLNPGSKQRYFRMRPVSEGMAGNAVLCLLLASALGVTDSLLQERLSEWSPARLRGGLAGIDGRLVYLDCYNANPASMADALSAFATLAPAELPRLYLLGGMEELGPEAVSYHRRLGAGLRLRPVDHCLVLGPHANAVVDGLLEGGSPPGRSQVAPGLDAMREALAHWTGAVFVKGSRRYQLETLFPEALTSPH
jgi:UDP-N-acetylmuramoyl-tripeptide--D-alanyl-D-alanine ligase